MTDSNLSASLGKKIKSTRLKKRVTLEEVAKQTNLTPSFLSQIERNLASPSVDSLRRIASALGARISSFFEEEENKGIVLFRKNQKATLPDDSKTQTIRLINDIFNINLHPFIIQLAAGTDIEKELPAHDDEEFGMVIKGKILISMKGETHIMEQGDCIYLTNPVKHTVINNTNDPAEILWIYCSKY